MPNANGTIRKIGLNMFWLILDKFLRYGLALFVGFWLARYLGVENFGIINNAIAFVTLFTALYTLGIDSIIVKELTINPHKRTELLGTSFILRLIGSLITMGICLTYHYIYSDILVFKIIAITTLMPIFQSFEVTDFHFQSITKSKMTVFGKFVGLIAVLSLRIFFIINHAPLIWFAIANIAEYLATSIALIYIYQKNVKDLFQWSYNQILAIKIFRESWPIAISMLGTFVYFKMGQIQIGVIAGEAAAGIYAAGIKFSEFWYFIPGIIFISVYPNLIESKRVDENFFNTKLLKIHMLMIWLSLSIGLIIYILAPYLIKYSYGNDYLASIDILRIHIWSGVFIFLNSSSQIWYLANGKTKLVIFNNLLGALVNIIANYFFIHQWGAIGACYSCILSYMVCNMLAPALVSSSRPLFYQLIKSFNPLNLRLLLNNK
jgi:PST family polysaccharide transporter